MSSVSPGNPADRLAPEVGWVYGWLWRGLGGGWHSRQAQQSDVIPRWCLGMPWPLISWAGKKGPVWLWFFFFFILIFSFESKEALSWGTFWEHELSSWKGSLVGAPPILAARGVSGVETKTQRPQQVTRGAKFKFKSPSSLACCCLHHSVNVLA